MIHVGDKQSNECCGCGICAQVCPVSAIQMVQDEYGFAYPHVDPALCIKCGKCLKKCNFNDLTHASEFNNLFVARHKSVDVCNKSTSGGMFTAISDWIFAQDGVIYATDFSDGMKLVHRRIGNSVARNMARGSKYVQSDTTTIWEELLNDLKSGIAVGYFGTPCQVGAVNALVPEELKANLYTIDVVCNGVGSPTIWSMFIRERESQAGKQIVGYNFRPKTRGYLTPSEITLYSDNTSKEEFNALKKYNSIYYSNLIMRPSCGNCKYCSSKRTSDITIGDCSHTDRKKLPFDAECGLSTVLINTAKGKCLFDYIVDTIMALNVSVEECSQIRLKEATKLAPDSLNFMNECRAHGVHRTFARRFGIMKKLRFYASALLKAVKK